MRPVLGHAPSRASTSTSSSVAVRDAHDDNSSGAELPPDASQPPITMARFSRRLNGCQWLGLVVLLIGFALLLLAFHVKCGAEQAGCDNGYSWQLFDAGFVCLTLFCCVPSFALTEPELFYDAFPGLRKKFDRRFRDAQDVQDDESV